MSDTHRAQAGDIIITHKRAETLLITFKTGGNRNTPAAYGVVSVAWDGDVWRWANGWHNGGVVERVETDTWETYCPDSDIARVVGHIELTQGGVS